MSVDYPDWTSLRALVNAMAATGVPLLRATNGLGAGSAVNAPHVNTITMFNNAIITQPSFEASFSAHFPAGQGTSPFMRIAAFWSNSATGTQTDTEQYAIPIGNGAGNDVTVYLSGPCRGDRLTMTASNQDAAIDASFTYAVNETSHVFDRDRLVQPALTGIPPIGFTWGSGLPMTGLLFSRTGGINPSTNVFRLMPVWNGRVRISVDNGGQAGQVSVSFQDPANLYQGVGLFSMEQAIPGGNRLVYEAVLLNGPLNVLVRNEDTVNVNSPTVYIHREEY